MSEIKLLPCPFCSNKDVRLQHRGRNQYGYYVICKNCGCRTPYYKYQFSSNEKLREEAIATWNTRKPMERIIERLEEEATAYEDNFGELIDCIPEHIAIEIVREESGIE